MTVFGDTAINEIIVRNYEDLAKAPLDLKLFVMLEALPLQTITSFIGIVLVIVFFVTSSDSGSIVIDTITAGGKVDAPVPQRVFWASFEGLVAIALSAWRWFDRASGDGGFNRFPVYHRCCCLPASQSSRACEANRADPEFDSARHRKSPSEYLRRARRIGPACSRQASRFTLRNPRVSITRMCATQCLRAISDHRTVLNTMRMIMSELPPLSQMPVRLHI